MSTYSFSSSWSDHVQTTIQNWIIDTCKKWEGEEPDQDFLAYILVVIKNKKTMKELLDELLELGTDEKRASDFVDKLEHVLRDLDQNESQVVQSSYEQPESNSVKNDVDAPSNSSNKNLDSLLSGALKSSRQSNSSGNPTGKERSFNKDGMQRQFNSALKSDRNVKNDANHQKRQEHQQSNYANSNNANPRQTGTKRKESTDGQGVTATDFPLERNLANRLGNKRARQESHDNQSNNNITNTSQMTGTINGINAAVDPVAYFQEMNRIAKESGFKNAQEMLASQKEVMTLMMSQQQPSNTTPAASYPLPAAPYHTGGRGHSYPPMAGGGGRFGGHYKEKWRKVPYPSGPHPSAPTENTVSTEEATQGETQHKQVETTTDPTSTTTTTTTTTSPAAAMTTTQVVEGGQETSHPVESTHPGMVGGRGGYPGRGSGRGGVFGGRGGAGRGRGAAFYPNSFHPGGRGGYHYQTDGYPPVANAAVVTPAPATTAPAFANPFATNTSSTIPAPSPSTTTAAQSGAVPSTQVQPQQTWSQPAVGDESQWYAGANTGYYPNSYPAGGRGGRGRGRGGFPTSYPPTAATTAPPASKHKVWVRPTDVTSSLASNR